MANEVSVVLEADLIERLGLLEVFELELVIKDEFGVQEIQVQFFAEEIGNLLQLCVFRELLSERNRCVGDNKVDSDHCFLTIFTRYDVSRS